MKNFKYIFILLVFLFACRKVKDTDAGKKPSEIIAKITEEKKSAKLIEVDTLHTILDSVTILEGTDDESFVISKDEYNDLVDSHPEFFEDYARDPDILYASVSNDIRFRSEVGQDTYYCYYAHFLKQRNGVKAYENERNKLIAIFRGVNSVFQKIQGGGTYFGHQHQRILGHAEYSVDLLKLAQQHGFEKSYDIEKQKRLYVRSLRQLIVDELSINHEIGKEEKSVKEKELNDIVDELDLLITDIFYLRRAQEFHYSQYEYH